MSELMTASTLSPAERMVQMSWMTGLNEIALSLWVGLDYYFFPTAYMAIGV